MNFEAFAKQSHTRTPFLTETCQDQDEYGQINLAAGDQVVFTRISGKWS